jgi:predicted Zn-dependent protease
MKSLFQGSLAVMVLIIFIILVPVSGLGVTPYSKPDPKLLHSIPDTAPLEFLAAVDLLEHGDTDDARRLLRDTLRDYPRHEPTLARYLQVIHAMEGTNEAIEVARTHVRQLGTSSVLETFVRSLDSSDRYQELFQWLHEENLLQPFVVREYGEILRRNRQYNRAEAVYRSILSKYPRSTYFQLKLAELLAIRGNCEMALKKLNSLLERRPGWAKPYRLKYEILMGLDGAKATEVLQIYESLIGDGKHSRTNMTTYHCD